MTKPKPHNGFETRTFAVVAATAIQNEEISKVVNEAWHVHRHHPEMWKREGNLKDRFAEELHDAVQSDPRVEAELLALKDRVLSMLIYRGRELGLDGRSNVRRALLRTKVGCD